MRVRPTPRGRPPLRGASGPRAVLAAAALAAVILGAAGCSSGTSATSATTTPATTTPATTGGSSGASDVVSAASRGSLGEVLVDGQDGATLYRYTPDGTGTPTCTGGCATTWPPLTVPAGTTTVTSGAGVPSGALGTVSRSDGSLQVTFRGMPLYRYAGTPPPATRTARGSAGCGSSCTRRTPARGPPPRRPAHRVTDPGAGPGIRGRDPHRTPESCMVAPSHGVALLGWGSPHPIDMPAPMR